MRAYKAMLKTELKLSFRSMYMLIFAIGMPLVVLIVLGIIYGTKSAFAGADYTLIEQSFGALSSISICAGGVMGLPLVISDYRGKHILKRFRVIPVSPSVILLVQVTIYALYSLVSLISLFAVAKLFFGFALRGSVPLFLLGWLLVMVSMFSVGMMVGGIAKNNKIAGIIASILYFPMLIFSGATLPYEVMPSVMQRITDILPLTQGIKILKAVTLGIPTDNIVLPVIVMSVVAAVCTFVSLKWFRWE